MTNSEDLLADNYFHAVLEAVKSVMDKLREKTGLTDDGNTLVERALRHTLTARRADGHLT